LQTDVSSKASVTKLNSVKTNLKNEIDSKASEIALQTLKVRDCIYSFYRIQISGKSYFLQTDISSKVSVTELDSLETTLKNQIDSKASEIDLQTLKVRRSFFPFLKNLN
jgi:hypothetical protein